MAFMYQIYRDENGAGMTLIFSDGVPQTLTSENANYELIKSTIQEAEREGSFDELDEEYLRDLMVPGLTAGAKLTRLSERVTFDGGNILFDGDIIDGAIAEHILRIVDEGGTTDAYAALVHFLEKIAQNPTESSRNSLYDFIVRHGITIDPDGDFYVYKGVRSDGKSIHSGFGIVNGVAMNGNLPNLPGSILEMPRSKVNDNTAIGCSTGLHAGTYNYANNFSQGQLLMVKVNPRDVVSVPDDCSYQKIRVSRYKVISTTDVQVTSTTYSFAGNGEHNSDTLADLIQDHGGAEVSFTYARGNGEETEVEAIISSVYTTDDGEVVLATDNGKAFRYEFITNFHIVDLDDYYDDEYDEYDDSWVDETFRDSEDEDDDEDEVLFTVPATLTVESLIERVENGDTVTVSFDYTTISGEARTLTDFEATEVRRFGNNVLIFGTRADGEERNYRSDRISNLNYAK